MRQRRKKEVPIILPAIAEFVALKLMNAKPTHGMDVVTRSNGLLKKASAYTLMARMLEKGYIADAGSEAPEKGMRGNTKRLYHITPLGQNVLMRVEALS
jgi:DNA-binding PadR family transcriptional regulator